MAKKDFLVDLDLNQNQLLNAVLQVLGVDPSAIEGQVWYNSGDERITYRDNTGVRKVATLEDVEGLLDFKGGYDANTNTPDLVTPAPGAVLKGDAYVVTVGGIFFGEEVSPGDFLFAKVDDPAALADWVVVERNLPDGVTTKFSVDLNDAEATVTRVEAGGQTTFTVTHGLNTLDVEVDVKRLSDGRFFGAQISATGVNTVEIVGNGSISNAVYRAIIIG